MTQANGWIGTILRINLTDGSDNFRMLFFSDDYDFPPFFGQLPYLPVHFGNQRAGGVDNRKLSAGGFRLDGFGNTMCRKNDRTAVVFDFVKVFNKYDTALPQVFNHVPVVDDFMPHVNRCAVIFQGFFHQRNCPFYTGAEPARHGEVDVT